MLLVEIKDLMQEQEVVQKERKERLKDRQREGSKTKQK